jgi:hypothetical protein
MCIDKEPEVVLRLCYDGSLKCVRQGLLRDELDCWGKHSAMMILLHCIKRTQTPVVVGRLNDVLREVLNEFVRFDMILHDLTYYFDGEKVEMKEEEEEEH